MIRIQSSNPQNDLETGSFLGELKNELDADDFITLFVETGPKSYSFRTHKVELCVKIKGFSLNFTNAQAFSFENLQSLVDQFVASKMKVLRDGADTDDENDDIANDVEMFEKNHAECRSRIANRFHKNRSGASAVMQHSFISVYNPAKIARTKEFKLMNVAEQKVFFVDYDKRCVISEKGETEPYGF